VLPEVEEAIKWSHPTFLVDGKIMLGMAAFKAHAALNFWRAREIDGLDEADGAMGQFGKLVSVDDLPANLGDLILRAAAVARTAKPSRPSERTPKPESPLHPAFAAALAKEPAAKATLDGFAPSHRRDYLEWINEAKRDETRAKRIATAIDWLREGRKRHWKYENC
jgi:uncharacterized protein YdeI (YjbR/CyaY-like superfamily)